MTQVSRTWILTIILSFFLSHLGTCETWLLPSSSILLSFSCHLAVCRLLLSVGFVNFLSFLQALLPMPGSNKKRNDRNLVVVVVVVVVAVVVVVVWCGGGGGGCDRRRSSSSSSSSSSYCCCCCCCRRRRCVAWCGWTPKAVRTNDRTNASDRKTTMTNHKTCQKNDT